MNRVSAKIFLASTLLSIGALSLCGCGGGEIDGTAATGSSEVETGIGDASNVEPLPRPPKLEVPEDDFE